MTNTSNEAWIIDTARSPRGVGKQGKGSLAHIHPQKVLGQVLNGLRDRVKIETDGQLRTAHTPATTRTTSAAWRCSMPAGRSPFPA